LPTRSSWRAVAPKGSAPLFAALGDETRLRLLARVCDDGPQSIAKLAEGSAITRQAITKHLGVMEDAGLMRSTRQGRERIWYMDPRRLDVARRYLELVSERWDDALNRLRAFVED
jgi:DNA-binding transcriptional ArsR family regulator